MNACERDNDAVTITLSKAAEYSQAKGAMYTHLLCLLCQGSVRICLIKSLTVHLIFNLAFVDVEELSRGRTSVESLSYCIGLLYRTTVHHTPCVLPCHTSHSFVICLSGKDGGHSCNGICMHFNS